MSGNNLADLLQAALGFHTGGRRDRARRLYLDYLARMPDDSVALYAFGVLCLDLGDAPEAARRLAHALRIDPGNADAALALGRAHIERGDFESALAAFDRAAELSPGDADAQNGRGAAFLGLGQAEEALAAHQAALALQPESADALTGQGNALLALGRFEQAVDLLQQALAACPDNPGAANSLGAAFKAQGRLDAAKSAFEAALAARADFPEALANLGSTCSAMGLGRQARETYERAMRCAPSPALAMRLALLMPPIVESARQIDDLRDALAEKLRRLAETRPRIRDPYAEVGETAFYLAYHGRNDLALQQAIAAVYQDACPELTAIAPHCARRRQGKTRLRLGLVSAFFHNHTIGKLYGGLIEHLDRRRFEVVLARLPGIDDAKGRALMAAADQAANLPDSLPRARQKLAEAACDILFYPDIGMHALSYFLAFARLAPVQCVGWGHPLTTGIPNMDYFLSSQSLTPENGSEGFSERLARFPRLPIRYPRPAPLARAYERRDFGLPEKGRIYLCPQSLFKFHPDFDAALSGILQSDPDALIVTIHGKHPLWAETLRARFAASFDHDPARIVFLPRLSMDDFTGALSVADILLDTFHFGGGNTTLEALAQNAPVVTLPSEYLRGRISLACYRQMDLDEPVAASQDEYVEKAVRLAGDRDARAALGRRIEQGSHALFDDDGVVREMEDFFEAAYRGEPLF
jgi:predicted O-linked N-acetylglucosamine transferase (SPINDLY family)